METIAVVTSWAAWAPGLENHEDWRRWAAGLKQPLEDGQPGVSFFPAMYRRRLSRIGKMAMAALHQCEQQGQSLEPGSAVIFASRYGEERRTESILNNLVQGEAVSPTTFSLSVHNAIAGLYSIVAQNTAATTSLAAGKNTLAAAWIEAVALLKSQGDSATTVTVVYYDEPLQGSFAEFQDEDLPPLALAMQLQLAEPNGVVDVAEWVPLALKRERSDVEQFEPLPLALIRLLVTDNQQTEGAGNGCRWIWKRHERP